MRNFVLMTDYSSYLKDHDLTPNTWLLPKDIGLIVLGALSALEKSEVGLRQIQSIASPIGKAILGDEIAGIDFRTNDFMQSLSGFKVLECGKIICDGNTGNQLIYASTNTQKNLPLMLAFKKAEAGIFKDCWMFDGLYPLKLHFPIMDI